MIEWDSDSLEVLEFADISSEIHAIIVRISKKTLDDQVIIG